MISQSEIHDVSQKIITELNPEKIILFGSYASGIPTSESDLDLLVIVKESDLPRRKRAVKIRRDILDSHNFSKDILVYTQNEFDEWKNIKFSFINQVISTGKTIYDRHS